MGTGKFTAGGNPATDHPIQRGVEIVTPSRFMLRKPGLKGGPSFWKLFKLDQTDPFNFGPREQKSKSGEEKW